MWKEREAHRILIKPYRPFDVLFQNQRHKKYEFSIDLANELKVTRRTVLNYLQGKSLGYINYGIKEIKYS